MQLQKGLGRRSNSVSTLQPPSKLGAGPNVPTVAHSQVSQRGMFTAKANGKCSMHSLGAYCKPPADVAKGVLAQ